MLKEGMYFLALFLVSFDSEMMDALLFIGSIVMGGVLSFLLIIWLKDGDTFKD